MFVKPSNAITKISGTSNYQIWALRSEQIGIMAANGSLTEITEKDWKRAVSKRKVVFQDPPRIEQIKIDLLCYDLVSQSVRV